MPGKDKDWQVVGYDEPEGAQLHIDPNTGRAVFVSEQAYKPEGASLSGPMPHFGRGVWEVPGNRGQGAVPGAGMGGTRRPAPAQAAQRQPSAEELKALADAMIASMKPEQGPSQVEPVLEKDTGSPWWLRNYMAQPENQPSPERAQSTEERAAADKYGSDEDKARVKQYTALKPNSRK